MYSSIVFGQTVRHREAQSSVNYPTGISDEDGLDSYSPPGNISWLRGWNFITELYRILEHALERFHGDPYSKLHQVFGGDALGPDRVLDRVLAMYSALPQVFKECRAMSGEPVQDRYSFQAANIIVTMQVRLFHEALL